MRRAVLLVPVVLLLFDCSGSNNPTGPRASALRIVSGNTQQATVGTALASPIVVDAVDAQAQGIAGLPVTFTVLSGGGSVRAASTTTDAQGQARTTWTLGTTADTQRVSAKLTNGVTTLVDTIVAVATAGAAKTLTKSAGDNQGNYPGYALADSLAVTMVDQYKNPVSGLAVKWTVTGGNGSVSPASSTTNAAGVAKTKWTVGPTAGANTATAAASGLTAVTFQATGGGNPNVHIRLLQKQVTTNAIDDTTTVHATATDQNGFNIAGAVLTWTSSAPQLLSVTSTGNLTARITVKSVGAARVFASYNGSADTAVITMQQLPARVVLPDTFPAVVLHQTLALAPQALDSNGVVIPNAPVSWTIDDPSIVSISPSGLASGLALGSTRVSAGKSPQIRISVARQAPANVQFVQIVNGGDHACGLSSIGEAWCWGNDNESVRNAVPCVYSQQNYANGCPGPVPVSGGLTFTTLSAAYSATCGLTAAGATYCWGTYAPPEGPYWPYTLQPTPTAVAGAPPFAEIAVGGVAICGLTASGAAYCWGSGYGGMLGNGSSTGGSARPVAVSGGMSFKHISAGFETACGLLASGAAYCWGDNSFGEVGNGDQTVGSCPALFIPSNPSVPCSTTPVPVAGTYAFTSIALNAETTCGLLANGAMYCWGSNVSGQLGVGSSAPVTNFTVLTCNVLPGCSLTPVQVGGGTLFAAIGQGPCALDASGNAYCWSDDTYGQVGNGQINSQSPVMSPTGVVGGLHFTSVAFGSATCGLTVIGKAYCWGEGGNLGTGATGFLNATSPQLVIHR